LNTIEERKKGIYAQQELTFISKQGKIIYTLIQSTPIYTGGQYSGSISMLLDITEKRRAEEQLRLSEQKYRIVFENNPLPMLIAEYPGRNFVAVNNAFLEKFGYRKDELEKMTITKLRRPEEVGESDEVAKLLVRDHHFSKQLYLRKKDGTDLLFDVQISEIFIENKMVYLTSTRDITEQVKAEKELTAINEQLKELTIYLQEIREDERKSISREIHDELGQQLTALKLDLSWMNRKVPTGNEPVLSKMKSALELVDGTLQTIRRIAGELRPSMLDDLGLAEAIRWQTNQFEKRNRNRNQF